MISANFIVCYVEVNRQIVSMRNDRLTTRLGLIRARALGAEYASGDVLVFLDRFVISARLLFKRGCYLSGVVI